MAGTERPGNLDNVLANYRLSSSPSDVNWQIRKHVDEDAIRQTLLPGLVSFMQQALVGRIRNEVQGLVALSGGLDSTVATYLTAYALNEYRALSETSEWSFMQRDAVFRLSVLHCPGFEDIDAEALVDGLSTRFPKISIEYISCNITAQMKALGERVSAATKLHSRLSIPGPGLMLTRTIAAIAQETSARLGCAAINTTNGTEYLLGEYADGICFSVSPFINLYKSTLFGLGRVLGVPEAVLERKPVNSAFPFTDKLKLYFGEIPPEVSPQAAFETLDAMLYFLTEKTMSPRSLALRTDHSTEFLERLAQVVEQNKLRRKYHVLCTEQKTEDFGNLVVVPYDAVLENEVSSVLLSPKETKAGEHVLKEFEAGNIRRVYGGG